MTYLILGGAGQLAHSFRRLLGDQAIALDRAQADLSQPAQLREALDPYRPQVLINCAAYNLVDQAETDWHAASTVNTVGPIILAKWCREHDCLLVHFSTNYVFGLIDWRRTPYREDERPGPISIYGHSKLGGEEFVRPIWPRHLIVRTCGLFGQRAPGKPARNFVATMLRLARERKPIRVVDDQVCTPTSCDDLARATLNLIRAGRTGLWHLTNDGECSWHQFAGEIFALAGIKVACEAVSSAAFGAAARRPAYSVLDGTAYDLLGLGKRRPWQDALADYVARL